MSDMEEFGRLAILGAISQLPAEEKAKVEEAIKEVREVVAKHGEAGKLAVSLVILEVAKQNEQ